MKNMAVNAVFSTLLKGKGGKKATEA